MVRQAMWAVLGIRYKKGEKKYCILT